MSKVAEHEETIDVDTPFEGIEVRYDISRFRSMGVLARKQKGIGEFTSDEARAFVLLHGIELADRLNQAVREFMKEKL